MALLQLAEFEGSVFCLSQSKLLVDHQLFSLDDFGLLLDIEELPANAELTDSLLLTGTSNSLTLWDLHDFRPHVFWKGSCAVPPVALVVDEIGCVGWVNGKYELYDLNGVRTHLVRSPYARPRQARLQGSLLLVMQEDSHLIALDFSQGVVLQTWDWHINCIDRGHHINIAATDVIFRLNPADLTLEQQVDLRGDCIVSLHSQESELTVVTTSQVLLYRQGGVFKHDLTGSCRAACTNGSKYVISSGAVVTVWEFGLAKEPEVETQLVAVQTDLNVNMIFEPLPTSVLTFIETLAPSKPKKPVLPEKPVTFHKKIKSSGYGKPSAKSQAKQKQSGRSRPVYSTTGPHPNFPQASPYEGALHAGPVICVRYSNDGQKLATCGGDRVGNIVKLSSSQPQTLVGHELPLTCIAWSAASKLVLTTSLDSSLKLWSAAGDKAGECLWTVPGDFTQVQFYYQDRFIAASQGNKVQLYRYKLKDPQLKDDVKRLASKCSGKVVARGTHPDAQAVARFTAHNTFHSHLLLLGGSNRSVAVWDVNANSIAAQFDHGHRRPLHSLRLYESSCFIAESDADWYNLFLTAASDNTVKIFDLRQQQEAACLMGHTNTGLSLGAAISPCGRFVASGSEDRAVYIWDIRSTHVLDKLRGFKETVSDVAFNPATTQLCAGSFEGCVRFFGVPPRPQAVRRGGMRTGMLS
jgi:WD40 repeat protein